MLTDAYGNSLTTQSNAARDAYDLAVRKFLGAEPGVAEAFAAALAADDSFALGHIGLAREMQLHGRSDMVKVHLKKAREMATGTTERERSHIEVSGLLLEGKSADARSGVYGHVKEWPTDVMIAQMCTSVFGLIGFSGLPGREAEQLAYTSALTPHYGDNWWFRAQLAFAQLEVGQLADAETNIEMALAANPKSAHSAHIRAHLYYENDEDAEGLRFLSDWLEDYGPEGTLFNHASWHVGLWSLEAGDLDRMWHVLDSAIDPETSQGPPLNVLTDATALLFRAELLGVDVPSRYWRKVADYALARFPRTGLAFADVHAAIAHARGANRDALNAIIDNARGPAANVTRTLATGFREMEDKNWARAADLFEDVLKDHARIGGSNAQRDLIDFSLAACLARDGRKHEARTVLKITRPRALVNELVAGL